MENISTAGFGSLLDILGPIALALAGFLAKQYLIPYLQIGRRKRYAEFIARIADEVTDELRTRHPQNKWLKHLDEAVDTLIEIAGISPDIARRAVNASAARK